MGEGSVTERAHRPSVPQSSTKEGPSPNRQGEPRPASGGVRPSADALRFHAVTGHPTLPQLVDVVNAGSSTIALRATIRGDAAAAFIASPHEQFAPTEISNRQPAQVGVRFAPARPGPHAATLVLRHPEGEAHVPLEGTALTVPASSRGADDAHAEPGTAVQAPATAAPTTRAEARSQLLQVASKLSGLAGSFETTVAGADPARAAFAARLTAAGGELNARIVQWIAEEGITRARQVEQDATDSGATEFMKFALLKGAELGLAIASRMNPVAAAAMIVVDLGWSMYDAHTGNAKGAGARSQSVAGLNGVADHAASATNEVTRQLMTRFAGLTSRYDVARAAMFALAGESAETELASVQDKLADLERSGDLTAARPAASATLVIEKYQTARSRFARALREIAAESAQARTHGDAAFRRLVEEYLRHRATGTIDSAPAQRTMVSRGYINFDAPRPVGLSELRIGQVTARDLSPTVSRHVTSTPLASLTGWAVTFDLDSVQGGRITLHQGAAGASEGVQVIPDGLVARVERMGGTTALWTAVDAARGGAR